MEDALIQEIHKLRKEIEALKEEKALLVNSKRYRLINKMTNTFYATLHLGRTKKGIPENQELQPATKQEPCEETPKPRNIDAGRVDIVNVNFYQWDGETLYCGGAERYVYDLAKLLQKMGYRPRILQGANHDFRKIYRGIEVIGLKSEAKNEWQLGMTYNKVCADAEFIIASPDVLAVGITDVPCIGINHGSLFDGPWVRLMTELPEGDLINPYWFAQESAKNVSCLVCVDTNVINWMRTRDRELSRKARYIPNYYDPAIFRPSKTNHPDDEIVFVFPRRIVDARGYSITLKAFEKVVTKYPKVKLVLAGQAHDAGPRKRVEAFIAKYPNNVAHIQYSMEDAHKAYRGADVALIPTIATEGTSLSCIEAQAAGLAVIATDVGGLPNLVLDHHNGLLITPTAHALARAMFECIENPDLRAELGKNAIITAKNSFKKSRWESRWERVIQDFTNNLHVQPNKKSKAGAGCQRYTPISAPVAEVQTKTNKKQKVNGRNNKRVLVVFGTRPEAIKMAPVVKELEQRDGVEPIVCVTAQHRKMLDQVLEIFKITPDYDLDIMEPGQTLTTITSKVLESFEEVLTKVKPDLVLVHGDTTTAMAACLASFYQQIPIGHVEAGLRTHDKYSPFPEEINRQIIDNMADLLFAPTEMSAKNLRKKLNTKQEILVTGNTAIDALKTTVSEEYQHEIFDWIGDGRMILLTAHRRENLGEPMRRIFIAVKKILQDFPDVKVVYPVHLNPKVQSVAKEILGDEERVRLIEPLDVLDFHNFMEKAHLIMSDSGGVQEEAPALGKPVLVLRDTTERPEGIEAGTLKLVGTDTEEIYATTAELLKDSKIYEKMAQTKNPYGDGEASRRIVDTIIRNEIK